MAISPERCDCIQGLICGLLALISLLGCVECCMCVTLVCDLGTNCLQLFGALTYNRKRLLGLAFADTALESMEKSGFSFEVLTVKDLQTVKYTKN